MQNATYSIRPYRYQNQWVFDDPRVDRVKEPFVMGIPEIIDNAVQHLPNAKMDSQCYLMTRVCRPRILFSPGNLKKPVATGMPANKQECVAGFVRHCIDIAR